MQRHLLASLLALFLLIGLPLQPAQAAMDYAKQVLIGADFSNREMQGVTFNLTNLRERRFRSLTVMLITTGQQPIFSVIVSKKTLSHIRRLR